MKSITDVDRLTWERFKEIFYRKYFSEAHRLAKAAEFTNLKQGGMSVCDYIKKFDELSRFAPHMVSTNELKVNQFLQGLKAEIYRDIKMATGKGVPYTEVAEKALEAEEAELKVVKALEIRRNINMARRNANFGKGTQPGFNSGKRKFSQGQRQRQDPSKCPAVGQ